MSLELPSGLPLNAHVPADSLYELLRSHSLQPEWELNEGSAQSVAAPEATTESVASIAEGL